MVNYDNGKIYKIKSNQTNKIYVGSTTKTYLSQRMDQHRSAVKVILQEKLQTQAVQKLLVLEML